MNLLFLQDQLQMKKGFDCEEFLPEAWQIRLKTSNIWVMIQINIEKKVYNKFKGSSNKTAGKL